MHSDSRRPLALPAVCLAAAILTGCGTQQAVEPSTELRVQIYADGRTLTGDYTLACDGQRVLPDSTLPRSEEACALIDESPKLLEPSRAGRQTCTLEYGGPQRAEISGTHQGKRIDATFDRTNGCAIDEWNSLKPLLGPSGL